MGTFTTPIGAMRSRWTSHIRVESHYNGGNVPTCWDETDILSETKPVNLLLVIGVYEYCYLNVCLQSGYNQLYNPK